MSPSLRPIFTSAYIALILIEHDLAYPSNIRTDRRKQKTGQQKFVNFFLCSIIRYLETATKDCCIMRASMPQKEESSMSKRFITGFVASVLFIMAGSAFGQRSTIKPLPHIGQITGTITWFRGQVPITLGNTGIAGQIVGISDAVSIRPVIVKITPPHGTTFGSTIVNPIVGADIKFGKVTVSGNKIAAPYTVSKLPLGTGIQLEIKPKRVSGSFSRDRNPQDAILQLQAPAVSNFDFHFVEIAR
jgi:hypothetical protein